jgi:hypothetical protein
MRVFFFLRANASARPDAREVDMQRLKSCLSPLLLLLLFQGTISAQAEYTVAVVSSVPAARAGEGAGTSPATPAA